MQLPIRPNCSG